MDVSQLAIDFGPVGATLLKQANSAVTAGLPVFGSLLGLYVGIRLYRYFACIDENGLSWSDTDPGYRAWVDEDYDDDSFELTDEMLEDSIEVTDDMFDDPSFDPSTMTDDELTELFENSEIVEDRH